METIIFSALGLFVFYKFYFKPRIIGSFREGLNVKDLSGQKKPLNQKVADHDSLKLKGDLFEQYIIKKFNKEYFTIKEWRSDKYINGIYAESNKNPDIELEFKLTSSRFAVECKYRKNLFNGGIEVAKDYQLSNYKRFGSERNMDVYIVVGLGGEPQFPEELFLIPVKTIENKYINYEQLVKHRKVPASNFFYNKELNILT